MSSQGLKTPFRIPGGPPSRFQEWDKNARPEADQATYSSSSTYIALPSIYGESQVPLLAPQYGNITVSRVSISAPNDTSSSTLSSPFAKGSSGKRQYEFRVKQAGSSSSSYSIGSSRPNFNPEDPDPTSCIICTEDFSIYTRPPIWISLACLHKPSVCCDCLAKCIKSDLDTKIWNQIKCPECPTMLIYEDIKRLADKETFSRYETLSFRSAVSADPNFFWCQNCDFGQLHESGNSQPIIRCLNCNHRTCFKHSVPWHERLTCEEYDKMLQDPDGFQSAIDKDDEATAEARKRLEKEDEILARGLDEKERRVEQDRQRQIHEEQLRREKAEQEAEAWRRKLELDRNKKREGIKRRQAEEQLSLEKVEQTTKRCPSCRWAIEKNAGCSHMTCIKCKAEFCWECLNDYHPIRTLGNSKHKRTCPFHTDNLPQQ